MSTTIGRLLIELAANTATFESDFSRAAKRAAAEAARIQRELERVGKTGMVGALQANTGLAALGKEATVTTNKLVSLNSIVGVLGASFGAWQLFEFAKSVVETTNKFIGFEQALIAVTGSQQQATRELDFSREIAEKLGLEITTVTKQYTALVAASRGSTLEGQGVRDIFTAISEAARVLNMSVYDTEGALRAVQQMISKGNVQAEELRGQLGERLYGAFLLAAEAMGVTQAELNDLLKQGKVAAEDLLPKFAIELRKVYKAQAEVASNTPAAEFNRLSIALTDLKREIGSGDFMGALVDAAKELTKYIKQLNSSGAVKEFSDNLGALIRMIDELVMAIAIFAGVRGIAGLIGVIGKVAGSAALASKGLTAMKGVIAAVTAIATGAIATIGKLNLVAAGLAATYLGLKNLEEKWAPTFAADAIKQALPVLNEFRTSIRAANEDIKSADYEKLAAQYAGFREQVKLLSQAYAVLNSPDALGATTGEGRKRLAELQFLREKIIETERAANELLPVLEAISAGPPRNLMPEGESGGILSDSALKEMQESIETLENLIASHGDELEKLNKQYQDDLKVIDEVAKKYGTLPKVMKLVATATDRVQLAYSNQKKELAALIPMQKEFTSLLADVDPYFRQAAALKENLIQLQKIEAEWAKQGYDLQILQKIREKLIQSYNDETDEIRDRANPVQQLLDDLEEEVRISKLGNIERQRAIALRGMEADATEEQKAKLDAYLTSLEREAAKGNYGSFVNSSGIGQTLDTFMDWIGGAFEAGLTDSADSFVDVLKRGMKEATKDFASAMRLAADVAEFAASAVDSFRNNPDAPLRAVTEIAAQIPGIVGDVARAVQAIDSIFGGRLLGTNYEVDRTGRNVSFGQGGFSGSTFTRESRQRSFFRGRQTRTDTQPLAQDVKNQLDQVFDAIRDAMRQSAQALAVQVPQFISGAFEEIVDKNGKILKQVSTVLGKQYTETFEQFVKRLTGENIIAVIEAALAGSGEANAIAERFRANADDLLAAAKAMLQAQEAIQRGQGLLGTGVSLTDTIALVEELALAGEDLDVAFQRIYGSTTLLEEAIALTNVTLDLTREEFVRFATDISSAAGGLERATQLWNAYFDTFYSDTERVQFRLDQARVNRDTQLEDIGLTSDVTPDQFRQMFEEILPTLSAEAIVEWLEAAEAIGVVIDLEELLAETRRNTLGEYEEFMQGIRDALFEEDASDFALSLRDIGREMQANIDEANELARAAGMQGAAESDLAAIHELAARRAAAAIRALRKSTESLIAELYGSPEDRINTQISEIEARYSEERGLIDQVAQESQERYQRELAALQRINDFITDVMFSGISPLTPEERLNTARSNYEDILARAQNGDVDAIEQLQEASQRYLEEARSYFGSSQDYLDIFGDVTAVLRRLVAAGPQTVPIDGGGGGGPYSEELQRLYKERDELLARQTAENRLLLAMDLAEHLRQLSLALGVPIAALAEDLGLDLNALMEDLGINVDALTEGMFARLGDVATMLGLELAELADIVGFELGELGDINSIASQAFIEEIGGMPAGIRDRLQAAFDAVAEAVLSGGDTTDAVQYLQDLVDELPVEFRDQLAPFFDDIDPVEDPVVDWLAQIQGSNVGQILEMQYHSTLMERMIQELQRIAGPETVPGGGGDDPNPTNPPPPPPPPPEAPAGAGDAFAAAGLRGGAAEVVAELKSLRVDLSRGLKEQAFAITRQTEEMKRR